MASSDRGKGKETEALSPRAARAKLEEDLGKLDITDEEATPLVVDDREEGAKEKWMLAGKVLFRNVFHIQTILAALRPAWGNPKGLFFRSFGENCFIAEFATKRDRDRVWEGPPWHVRKNVVILKEFEDCLTPSELCFDRLQIWARVLNLPFNLREKKWWLPIAHQIDKKASGVHFDDLGGFLGCRVTIDIAKPLRQWILIDSAKRKSVDMYEVQYEQIPHFCFSCGRLGHADTFCPTPGSRDEHGNLPFGKNLRAPDEWKKNSHNEGSASEHSHAPKRGTAQEYIKVEKPQLMITSAEEHVVDGTLALANITPGSVTETSNEAGEGERDAKKKKPTPTNSENLAEAIQQPCQEQ
ncbi:hypothetical protein ACQ4PT_033324 [Festuca glaucescens]